MATGRTYVGSSVNVWQRWQQHRSQLRLGTHHCQELQKEWFRYGEPLFGFVVLEETSGEHVVRVEREQWWIDHTTDVINTSGHAGSGPKVGHKQSAETRQKRSVTMTGFSRTLGRLTPIVSGVWAVLSIKSGQMFVSSTKDVHRMWDKHRRLLREGRHMCQPLQAEWQQHGPAFFAWVVLEETERQHLDERELWWVRHSVNLLNVKRTHTPPNYSPEARERMAAANRGRKKSPETIAKWLLSKAWYKTTDEHKKKLSEANKSLPPRSEEWRNKLREANLGKKSSPEHCAAISRAKTGLKASLETRAKMRASQIKAWEFRKQARAEQPTTTRD